MNTEERRQKLLERLETADKPITGTALAREFEVSRQIIVGDIGIIRAMGRNIYATPRGYLLPREQEDGHHAIATIVCRHDASMGLQAELEAIVDNGGLVRDVIVEHPIYGEIRGDLMLSTRRDVEAFLKRMAVNCATPLLTVTGGEHLHTIEAPDKETLSLIQQELRDLGILVEAK